MAAIVFSLTTRQVKALAAAGGRTKFIVGAHDTRTLQDLRLRDWISYDGYSRWSVRRVKVRPKGRAVLAMIRALQLHKTVKHERKTRA